MVSVSRAEQSLTADTISKLVDTTIKESQLNEKLVRDIGSTDILKEINHTMKTIKLQNDEITGDKW